MQLNAITGEIVDAAIKVHRALGPGLLESAYHTCLQYELRKRGLRVAANSPMRITYEEITIDVGYRADLLVEDMIIVELKAVSKLQPIHHAQLLSYLKLSRRPIGLLLNFHETRMRDGITRLISER